MSFQSDALDDTFWTRVGELSLRIVVLDTIVISPKPGLDPVWSSFHVPPLSMSIMS